MPYLTANYLLFFSDSDNFFRLSRLVGEGGGLSYGVISFDFDFSYGK